MNGPCMCGDIYCWSCGPAQGNAKCPACGKWSMDGGCDSPAECNRKCREQDEAYANQIMEMDRIAREWEGSDA